MNTMYYPTLSVTFKTLFFRETFMLKKKKKKLPLKFHRALKVNFIIMSMSLCSDLDFTIFNSLLI